MKATAIAPSNIAFIKYWGHKDVGKRIPANSSLSMNLDKLKTTTTVEFGEYREDLVEIDGERVSESRRERVVKHLNRLRKRARVRSKARVVSRNSFPTSTGLSSSASGFAALTLAGSVAAGLQLSKKELSQLARWGSGSACRSIADGFVEWVAGKDDKTSFAKSLFSQDYWDLRDIVVMVTKKEKKVGTSKGHLLAYTSPFYKKRLKVIPRKLREIKRALRKKDFSLFGQMCEAEALELHAIMMTSKPPLLYWLPESIKVMRLVQEWRQDGLESYFTVNTGQNVHILCLRKDVIRISKKLRGIKEVKKIWINKPAKGAYLIRKHLF